MAKRYSRQELCEQQKDVVEKLGLHKRSITPDTLNEIIFNESDQDLFYGELYKHKNNEVIRYGLNTSSQELLKMVEVYNSSITGTLETKSLTSIASEKNTLKNIETIKKHKINSVSILTKPEILNTNNAIDYLKNKAKTVLIDIFDRDADGKIRIENNIPETHTVVLYEKSGKYLVIDPSNATFSYTLAGAHEDIRLCVSNKFQIYKPQTTPGPNPDQYRDCIDIAVKLAFNLMVNSRLGFDSIVVKDLGDNTGYIDFQSIKDNPSIKEITNQKVMYSKLPKAVESYPMRAKQSSDVKQEKQVTTLLKYIDNAFSKVSQKIEELDLYHAKVKIGQKYTGIYEKTYTPIEYDKAVDDLYNLAQDISDTAGIAGDIKLLGIELDTINEL
jgi:hypothetical protein